MLIGQLIEQPELLPKARRVIQLSFSVEGFGVFSKEPTGSLVAGQRRIEQLPRSAAAAFRCLDVRVRYFRSEAPLSHVVGRVFSRANVDTWTKLRRTDASLETRGAPQHEQAALEFEALLWRELCTAERDRVRVRMPAVRVAVRDFQCSDFADAGASGIIVADLTPDEGAPFEAVARASNLAVVYLVAPTTPATRRAAVAARSGGFLYCVSLVGVTGARASLPSSVGELVRDVAAVSPVPVAVGFGVSRAEHVRAIAEAGAAGAIVASALVDALGDDGTDVDRLAMLVREVAAATGRAAAAADGGQE